MYLSGEWKEQGVSKHVALKCFFTSGHELSTEIEVIFYLLQNVY